MSLAARQRSRLLADLDARGQIGIYCIFLATYNYLADSYGQNSVGFFCARARVAGLTLLLRPPPFPRKDSFGTRSPPGKRVRPFGLSVLKRHSQLPFVRDLHVQGSGSHQFAPVQPQSLTSFHRQMHGYQYTGLFLSLLASLAIPFPFILYAKGPQIRAASRYASEEFERQAEQVRNRNKSAQME